MLREQGFQCWGLLYAILQSLMSALQITDPMCEHLVSSKLLRACAGDSMAKSSSVIPSVCTDEQIIAFAVGIEGYYTRPELLRLIHPARQVPAGGTIYDRY